MGRYLIQMNPAEIVGRLIETNDPLEDEDFDIKDVEKSEIYIRKDNPELFSRLESNPPEGAVGHFCRWAAQSYYTIYNRRATYVATRRRSGKGIYWRLIQSGYGSYPYFGSKNINSKDDYIEMPD